MVIDLNPKILQDILPQEYMRYTARPKTVSLFMALMSTFKGGLITSAMAVGVKAMKNWKLREERNLQLMRENADAQMQLLTAQIHPHFLFNTLNNIYSQTQLESPKGSLMIMELSDLLRYILYDGKKASVLLDHELQMMVDYINLEKIRYGNSLQMHLDLPEKTNKLYISPLVLLPFIENCFKHGASKQLHTPWINLSVSVDGNKMLMELSNGKAPGNEVKKTGGIGLQNVVNRLQLLYPDDHTLVIDESNEAFSVKLEITLSQVEFLSRHGGQNLYNKFPEYAG
jgi:LytS/YehU family sensor histidine kinase